MCMCVTVVIESVIWGYYSLLEAWSVLLCFFCQLLIVKHILVKMCKQNWELVCEQSWQHSERGEWNVCTAEALTEKVQPPYVSTATACFPITVNAPQSSLIIPTQKIAFAPTGAIIFCITHLVLSSFHTENSASAACNIGSFFLIHTLSLIFLIYFVK